MFEKILNYLEKFQILILGAILALGVICATHIVAGALPTDGITVTGSASKVVQSDTATLEISIISRNWTRKLCLSDIKNQMPTVIAYLKNNGIDEKDIDIKTTHGYFTYRYLPNGVSSNEVDHYNLYQPITIKSNDVQKIKKISNDITNLINKGIDLDVSAPEYYYSKLSDLKVELLRDATMDAKQRASAMLKSTNNRTGKIQSVRMGVFQITSANSTDVSDGGIYDTSSIEKKVTAVANVVFKIK